MVVHLVFLGIQSAFSVIKRDFRLTDVSVPALNLVGGIIDDQQYECLTSGGDSGSK